MEETALEVKTLKHSISLRKSGRINTAGEKAPSACLKGVGNDNIRPSCLVGFSRAEWVLPIDGALHRVMLLPLRRDAALQSILRLYLGLQNFPPVPMDCLREKSHLSRFSFAMIQSPAQA